MDAHVTDMHKTAGSIPHCQTPDILLHAAIYYMFIMQLCKTAQNNTININRYGKSINPCTVLQLVDKFITTRRYCYGKSPVRLSICDVEVSWSHMLEFFKNNFMATIISLISRPINICFLLSADLNITDLLQREHPKIFAKVTTEDQ